MSADPGTSSPHGDVVVALLRAPQDGVADRRASLLECASALAERLGGSALALTWKPSSEADLDGLSNGLVAALRRRGASAVLLADDDLGRQLAPIVALGLGTSAAVGCSDVVVRGSEVVYVKPVQGGWLERELTFTPGHAQVATVQLEAVRREPETDRGPAFAPRTVAPRTVAPRQSSRGEPPRVKRLELVPPDPRTVDLVHARRIIGVGVGSAGGDLLDAVAELAELLRSSVGATRPVVDDGHLPKERLIGQTGRTVDPELYLALGISGSPHHIAGVQRAEHIVAVNKDEHAAIVSYSDASFIGDLADVLPALVRRLAAIRSGDATLEGPRV